MRQVTGNDDAKASAARKAIEMLGRSLRPTEDGGVARTLSDVETNVSGDIAFVKLERELLRIADEAGLSFEWITNPARIFLHDEVAIAKAEKLLPRDWGERYSSIEVSVSQGHSEGWMLSIMGRPRGRHLSEDGRIEVDVIATAKYLGSRHEATWLAAAVREFLGA